MVRSTFAVWFSCSVTLARLAGSLLYPVVVAQTSYVPAGNFSVEYFPSLSDKTIIIILVLTFCARTNAALKGAPSGPAIAPEMVLPGAAYKNDATSSATRPANRIRFIVVSREINGAGERLSESIAQTRKRASKFTESHAAAGQATLSRQY